MTRLLAAAIVLCACSPPVAGRDPDASRPRADAGPLIPCTTNEECPADFECRRGFPFDRCRPIELDASAPPSDAAASDARNGFADACASAPATTWWGSTDTCTNFDPVALHTEPSACGTHARAIVRCVPSGESTSVAVVEPGRAGRFFWCGNEYVCTLELDTAARLACVSGGAPCSLVFSPD